MKSRYSYDAIRHHYGVGRQIDHQAIHLTSRTRARQYFARAACCWGCRDSHRADVRRRKTERPLDASGLRSPSLEIYIQRNISARGARSGRESEGSLRECAFRSCGNCAQQQEFAQEQPAGESSWFHHLGRQWCVFCSNLCSDLCGMKQDCQ